MEVEAKFGIPDRRTYERLSQAPALAGLELGAETVSHVQDHYLDTAEGALGSQGYACRLRQVGNRTLATLKGLGWAAGAIHRREEVECEVAGLLQPGHWPPGQARELALGLSAGRLLLPLLSLQQTRYSRPLSSGGQAVATLYLDEVRVCERGRILANYMELEAELLPGAAEENLERLAACLQEEWRLLPESRSKFERALALRSGAEPLPTARQPRPPRPGIEPQDPMSEAGRKVLRFHLQRMLCHEPGTRLGIEIEALHDMRVATRRMRAAVRAFDPYFEPGALARHERGLKRTGRALGPMRDLDVFREKTQACFESLPAGEREGLDQFLAVVEARRAGARQQMLAYLNSGKYLRFKERLAEFVARTGMDGLPAGLDVRAPIPDRVREVAPVAIYQRLAVVRSFDRQVNVAEPPIEQLHALRIACKQMRYTLEFFKEVLGPSTRALIDEIVAVQDHLGAVQDAEVAGQILDEYLARGAWGPGMMAAAQAPAMARGVQAYLEANRAELQRLLDTFPAAWQRIENPEFGRLVAESVASL